MRIAVLSSFNVDLLPQRLGAAMKRAGLPDAEIMLGEFGQIAQEALNPGSRALYPAPDAVILIPAAEDVDIDEVHTALDALYRRTIPTVYVVTFGPGHVPNAHVLNSRAPMRGQATFEGFLRDVRELEDPIVIDWDWHIGTDWWFARCDYFDPRLWYLARMRLNLEGLDALADLIAVHMAAYAGIVRKVLAVDLDGTLWGGVIGEDGMSGIQIGNEGLGLAYQDFQREILAIRETGVVLVACSKNNDTDALAVFDHHSGMLLCREHFATARINWDNKAESLVAMADELNLGLDSFVLLDDEPRERDYVRQALPEVAVPELPADPAYRPQFLRDLTLFRRISLTDTDTKRPAAYASHVARKKAQVGLTLEEYIASLEQEIDIHPVDEGSLARAAQLCQRTNQFNLTSKRYTLADLQEMLANPDIEVFTVAVRDRFGDSGIVGLAILEILDESARIDTFLLSCRALGRGIENALLAFIIRRVDIHHAVRWLFGMYESTAKNSQVTDFYARSGFEHVSGVGGPGHKAFRLDLAKVTILA